MGDKLRQALQAIGEAGALSEEAQRQIAAIIEEELEQREWDALVTSPAGVVGVPANDVSQKLKQARPKKVASAANEITPLETVSRAF